MNRRVSWLNEQNINICGYKTGFFGAMTKRCSFFTSVFTFVYVTSRGIYVMIFLFDIDMLTNAQNDYFSIRKKQM